MGEVLLKIDNLHVCVEGKPILKGIDLTLNYGQMHAIMGPNGSGKSTLANVLAGREGYEVTQGQVLYQGQDLLAMSPEARARAGLFLGFQYPVEIPGVSNLYFLKTALNAIRKHHGEGEIDAMDFIALVKERMRLIGLEEQFLYRSLNEGFSGGEKKRNEILQMLVLEPTLSVLDEIDSGLDIDALKAVAQGINALKSPKRGFLLITHYQRLLDYVSPNAVHVMAGGRIVKSGGAELAKELERKGYAWIEPLKATV
jgi:Fe-S cluster assembly ATP-binding protein